MGIAGNEKDRGNVPVRRKGVFWYSRILLIYQVQMIEIMADEENCLLCLLSRVYWMRVQSICDDRMKESERQEIIYDTLIQIDYCKESNKLIEAYIYNQMQKQGESIYD